MSSSQQQEENKKMTMGFELEIVVEYDSHTPFHTGASAAVIYELIARGLRQHMGPLFRITADAKGLNYTKWNLVNDQSIFTGIPPWLEDENGGMKKIGMEIISPVFFVEQHDEWVSELKAVLGWLKSNYTISVNRSTGFHVHVGFGESGVGLQTMKNLAILLCMLETTLDKLHPASRLAKSQQYLDDHPLERLNVVDTCVQSNMDNPRLSRCEGIEEIARLIQATSTTREIRKAMNIDHFVGWEGEALKDVPKGSCTRFFKYNFTYKKKTIEFRQHEGSIVPQEIEMWIRLVCMLMKFADVCSSNPDTFERLLQKAIELQKNGEEFGVNRMLKIVCDREVEDYYWI